MGLSIFHQNIFCKKEAVYFSYNETYVKIKIKNETKINQKEKYWSGRKTDVKKIIFFGMNFLHFCRVL